MAITAKMILVAALVNEGELAVRQLAAEHNLGSLAEEILHGEKFQRASRPLSGEEIRRRREMLAKGGVFEKKTLPAPTTHRVVDLHERATTKVAASKQEAMDASLQKLAARFKRAA